MKNLEQKTVDTKPLAEFKYRLLVISGEEKYPFVNRLINVCDFAFPDKSIPTKNGINIFKDALDSMEVTTAHQVDIKNEIADYFKSMALKFEFIVTVPTYKITNSKKTESNRVETMLLPSPSDYDKLLLNSVGVSYETTSVASNTGRSNRSVTVYNNRQHRRNYSSYYDDDYDDDYGDYYDTMYGGYGYGKYDKAVEKRDYYVIGYGSLVNERSRRRTLPQIKEESFVKVRGYSRLFNVGVGQGTVLNVIENPKGWMNAVLVKIPYTAMSALRGREMQYDEVEVPKESIEFSYGGHKIELDHNPVIYVSKSNVKIEPKYDYVQACIYGANRLSERFAEEFIGSTFLHDGTRLRTYLTNKFGTATIKKFKEVDSNY